MKKSFIDEILKGLERKSINDAGHWAQKYRIMGEPFPGKFSFENFPWTIEMHRSEAETNCVQKAAQMAVTEMALNRVFFKLDIEKVNCMYVLPSKTPDATDFSASRFDSSLELSPHLKNMFSDVKNVGHKRAGSANLYIRGSRSRAGLKSVSVPFMVFDEYDEMDQGNITLALERTAGQVTKQFWFFSTPTRPGYGISELYERSTKESFYFRCPMCSKMIRLIYPDSFELRGESILDPNIRDSYVKCSECKGKIEPEAKKKAMQKNEWVPERPDSIERGFYINQLYSNTFKPHEFTRLFFKAKQNPVDEQELYNSKLGLPHLVDGAQVKLESINSCIRNYTKDGPCPKGQVITLGVDVGKWLHYEVDLWELPNVAGHDLNVLSTPTVLMEGHVASFEELYALMHRWQVNGCVIDSNPERRKAIEFANKFFGYVWLCSFHRGMNGKDIKVDNQAVAVDRTTWLDLSLGRFRSNTIRLPTDISNDYKNHIQIPGKVYKKDADGNPFARYISNEDNDHMAFARLYAEVALPLAVSISTSQNINRLL